MVRPRIAVIGQSGPLPPEIADLAYRVGLAIAQRDGILFCGGRDGVMAAACRGAKAGGGLTVGILPGDDVSVANEYVDVPITTGLGMDYRSLVLMHAANAAIAIAGAVGTLLEMVHGYHIGRPVVALLASGGWAERIRPVLYADAHLDHRHLAALQFAADPAEAVALACAAVGQGGPGI